MKGRPFDWRILFNGKADAMLYEQGDLATDLPGQSPSNPRLSFPELKRRAYINPAAKAANQDPAFSERIRNNARALPRKSWSSNALYRFHEERKPC